MESGRATADLAPRRYIYRSFELYTTHYTKGYIEQLFYDETSQNIHIDCSGNAVSANNDGVDFVTETAEINNETDNSVVEKPTRNITMRNNKLVVCRNVRNSNKALFESIMAKVAPIVKKALNEGCGAGYEVTIEGLHVDSRTIKLSKPILNRHQLIYSFKANLKALPVDYWRAKNDFYECDSNGYEIYDEEIDDYVEEDFGGSVLSVKGGIIEGEIWVDEDITKSDVIDMIIEDTEDFSVSCLYGSGWSHVNLGDKIMLMSEPQFGDKDLNMNRYANSTICRLELDAPDISGAIGFYFENR